jgi:hypothetical protein
MRLKLLSISPLFLSFIMVYYSHTPSPMPRYFKPYVILQDELGLRLSRLFLHLFHGPQEFLVVVAELVNRAAKIVVSRGAYLRRLDPEAKVALAETVFRAHKLLEMRQNKVLSAEVYEFLSVKLIFLSW